MCLVRVVKNNIPALALKTFFREKWCVLGGSVSRLYFKLPLFLLALLLTDPLLVRKYPIVLLYLFTTAKW